MYLIDQSVQLMEEVDEGKILKLLEWMGRTSYKSENLTTTSSAKTFVRKIQQLKHLTILEHEKVSFKIICSRGISHELVRHRLFSITQESSRYCNYSKNKFNNQITCIRPTNSNLVTGEYTLDKNPKDAFNISNKTDVMIKNSLLEAEANYMSLINNGVQPQIARNVLPIALKTELAITSNLRELLYVLDLRNASDCHPDMVALMRLLLLKMYSVLPTIFENLWLKYSVPSV